MTRLFILLYLGVLAVLFAAWYIHGTVSQRRAEADRSRVFESAHGGGARLVAREIESEAMEDRDQRLASLSKQFEYPIDLIRVESLPRFVQQRISRGDDVVYFREEDDREVVLASLSSRTEVVRLGPFRDYRLESIEESIGGWMRLAAEKLELQPVSQRAVALEELNRQFEIPVYVEKRDALPIGPRQRLVDGAGVVFFLSELEGGWFAVTSLSDAMEVIRCGPFPSFEQIEQKAATTTLALVLLPAALAIALLLRPVARQLRHVETAAKTIAAGDLSARVDERSVRSAKPLAQAFNLMANRTETLVRTQRELLQAVSHELRTPLSRMRFAVDLIETAKDDEERKKRLESLDAATEELDELVDELLQYVRTETARPHLKPERIVVRDTIAELIPKYAALHPSIDFVVCDIPDDDETRVFADLVGFRRVLGNLLSNAGRFASSQVRIRAETSDGNTTIDIDDDGIGVPVADRQRVFEPFVRLEDCSSENGRGVGLGLALVKRIVSQHGGHVEILASPLGGCRIRTTWPRETIHQS